MRILLVKPFNISDHIQPSLGLGYLASSLRESNDIDILDCIKENVNLSRIGDVIKRKKLDVVGFQCYTFDIQFVKKALEIVKGVNKDVITVIGGPHPSAEPEESLKYFGDFLDYAFVGEAERGLRLLIDCLAFKDIDLSKVPGLVWRKNGSVTVNDPYFEDDLDSLNILAWDLIRPDTYPESQHGAFYKKFPIAPIMLTRGCPYNCTFCAGKVVSGKRLRKRSVSSVIEEIKLLYNKYGIREFHIIDDNFTLDKEYAKSFLDRFERLHLNVSWALPNGVRMENLDAELLGQMKRTGLYLVSLGIESGSDRVLGLMRKNLDVTMIRKAVRLINDSGLEVAGFFILGFPGERKEEIEQTINLSLELDLVRANFFTYLPFPGTESYLRLKECNELKNVNWDKFYFSKAPYSPVGISNKELRRLQRKAFLKFYLRPKIILKNLFDMKSFRHLRFLFKRFANWILAN